MFLKKIQTRRSFLFNAWLPTIGVMLLGAVPVLRNICYAATNILPIKSASFEKPRILIAFASYHGSTADIAKFIGKEFLKKNLLVEVLSTEQVETVTGYDLVIIGSPIHRGKWLDEIPRFVGNNSEALKDIPTACFITCLAASKTDEASIKQAESYLHASLLDVPEIKPFHTGIFAGKLDYGKCTFFERTFLKMLLYIKDVEEGDYRDWVKISSWAANLQSHIQAVQRDPQQWAGDNQRTDIP